VLTSNISRNQTEPITKQQVLTITSVCPLSYLKLPGTQIPFFFFLRRIILSSVTWPAVQYCSTLCHKRRDSRGGKSYWT